MGFFIKETSGLDKTAVGPKTHPGRVVIKEPTRIGQLFGIRSRARIEYGSTTGLQTAPISVGMAKNLLRLNS